MIKNLKFIVVLLGSILITSFVTQPKDKKQLMEESLLKRMNDYKKDKLEECYKKAMEEAEATVDSIIAIELGAGPIDTLDFPRKPLKPSFEPYDSLRQEEVKLEPLFENEETDILIDSSKTQGYK